MERVAYRRADDSFVHAQEEHSDQFFSRSLQTLGYLLNVLYGLATAAGPSMPGRDEPERRKAKQNTHDPSHPSSRDQQCTIDRRPARPSFVERASHSRHARSDGSDWRFILGDQNVDLSSIEFYCSGVSESRAGTRALFILPGSFPGAKTDWTSSAVFSVSCCWWQSIRDRSAQVPTARSLSARTPFVFRNHCPFDSIS